MARYTQNKSTTIQDGNINSSGLEIMGSVGGNYVTKGDFWKLRNVAFVLFDS